MNLPNLIQAVEYPESDGLPKGETDVHHKWAERILELMRYRYRQQPVYVTGNLLVFYEPGKPSKFVVPDCFVVLDCKPGDRRNFKIWEEPHAPDVVFEVTSESTSRADLVNKPPIYEQMGVKEYFLYDPTGSYLRPALQGFRLQQGELVQIEPSDGRLTCQTLGFDLRLEGKQLELIDMHTGALLLTEAEALREEQEAAEARIAALEEQLRKYKQD